MMTDSNHHYQDSSLIFCGDHNDRLRRYSDIAQFAGCAPLHQASLTEMPIALSEKAGLSVALIDLWHAPETAFHTAASTANICMDRDIAMIFLLSPLDIDSFYAVMPDCSADILLDDSPEEFLVSLGRAMSHRPHSFASSDTENPLQDLRQISADVSRIARALVQLAGNKTTGNAPFDNSASYIEPATASSVFDTPLTYQEEGEALTGFGVSEDAPARQAVTARHVRGMIKARRLREQYFSAELFADPAWDILLDLMAAHLENRLVSVSSLCIAACVPPTTALRWVRSMTESGILIRRADITDGRRVFITLSQETIAGMIGYFANVRRQRLMLA